MKWRLSLVVSALSFVSCSSDTGSGMVSFAAVAAGPVDAQAQRANGEPYQFKTSAGYRVALTRAELLIGAVYLNRSMPILGAQDTPCILPGVYAAEVTEGVTFDALSSSLNEFAIEGHGTEDRAHAAEVWLTGGRVDALTDNTRILEFDGTAEKGERTFRFTGKVTIGKNRLSEASDPAMPGANPLCKQRIVTPIPVDITPQEGGTLRVRVLPSVWFDGVDFAQLPGSDEPGTLLEFSDEETVQPEAALFQGLRSINAYRIDWTN